MAAIVMAMDEQTLTDDQLLQQAKLQRDRAAIDVLIRRYANLVYGIALRQTRNDAQLAADISQAVFIVFIRRLGSIRSGRALPGWFLSTTRFAAKDALRSANRRAHYERQASRSEGQMTADSLLEQQGNLEMIDEAIASLNKTDRDLVLMRYMQGREMSAIAIDIGITEQAARKRMTRAIERMRGFFAARGTALSAAAVGGLLAAAAAHPAPAALIQTTTAVAAPSAAASTIANGIGKMIVWSKLKMAAASCCAAALAVLAVVAAIQMQEPASPATAAPTTALAAEAPMLLEQATDELKITYALPANESIRMIKAPFSQARTVWADAKNPGARGANNIHSLGFLSQRNGELSEWYMSYPDQTLTNLAAIALRLDWYQIEGLDGVAWTPAHADFVIREGASNQDKLDGLARLIQQETGKPVRFVKTSRLRECIILTGGRVTGGIRNARQFDVLILTQEEFDNQKLTQWANASRPPGSTNTFQFQAATRYLGAPFLDERPEIQQGEPDIAGHRNLPSSMYYILPDAKLDPADPQYGAKLQRVVSNIQKQIGGEWKIEKRELETFVLETTP